MKIIKNCVHFRPRETTDKHKRKDILLILGYNADIYYTYINIYHFVDRQIDVFGFQEVME